MKSDTRKKAAAIGMVILPCALFLLLRYIRTTQLDILYPVLYDEAIHSGADEPFLTIHGKDIAAELVNRLKAAPELGQRPGQRFRNRSRQEFSWRGGFPVNVESLQWLNFTNAKVKTNHRTYFLKKVAGRWEITGVQHQTKPAYYLLFRPAEPKIGSKPYYVVYYYPPRPDSPPKRHYYKPFTIYGPEKVQ